MKLIKLTQGGGFYDGKPTYINVDHITLIREVKSHQEGTFNTAIEINSRYEVMLVKEELSEIIKLINQ